MLGFTEDDHDGGVQTVVAPLLLDTFQKVVPGGLRATGANAVVAATASGFAAAFTSNQHQAVQLDYFDDGGALAPSESFVYATAAQAPLSLAVDGENAAAIWSVTDGGPSVPWFVYQPASGPTSMLAQPTYTQNGDWFVFPTLGNAYADGGFPLVFGEAFSAGSLGSANYSLRTIGTDGSTTDAGIDALWGNPLQSPALATVGNGVAIAWVSGAIYLKYPGDLTPNQAVQVADAGPDGGFGPPSIAAFSDADGGNTVALAYTDPAQPVVYLWVGHGPGSPAVIPSSGAAPGGRTALAYDGVRHRFDLAFEDVDGGITVLGLCAP
jgi:hypothetical protein